MQYPGSRCCVSRPLEFTVDVLMAVELGVPVDDPFHVSCTASLNTIDVFGQYIVHCVP